MAPRILSSSFPDSPTKGRPVASSVAPGASPTHTSPAVGEPSPGTGFVADRPSGQRVHPATSRATASSDSSPASGPVKSSVCACPTLKPTGHLALPEPWRTAPASTGSGGAKEYLPVAGPWGVGGDGACVAARTSRQS